MASYRTKVFEKFELSKEEMEFIDNMDSGMVPDGSGLSISFEIHKALSTVYAIKQTELTGKEIEKALVSLQNQLEKSNSSSDKASNRMFWLTIALFFVGAVQAIAALIQIW